MEALLPPVQLLEEGKLVVGVTGLGRAAGREGGDGDGAVVTSGQLEGGEEREEEEEEWEVGVCLG